MWFGTMEIEVLFKTSEITQDFAECVIQMFLFQIVQI